MKYLVFILTLFSILGVSLAKVDCSTLTQRDVLLELYNSTSGATWTKPWDIKASDICSFSGVHCSGSVLDLSDNNLVGSIPESFYCLNIFTTIDLSGNNYLKGDIADITKLENIQYLYLSETSFNGTLPDFTGSAISQSLKKINIDSTCISGSIPHTIDQLSLITSIRASNTRLTGKLPLSLYDLDLYEMDFSCTSLDATDFDLEKFRYEKGLGINSVPGLHATHDGTQCHEAYVSSCCNNGIENTDDLCAFYYLAQATNRLVCFIDNVSQRIIQPSITEVQNCRNAGGRILTAGDVTKCRSNQDIDAADLPTSLCEACTSASVCYFPSNSTGVSFCIDSDIQARSCYINGGYILQKPQYCKSFKPCNQCQFYTEILKLSFCFNGENSYGITNDADSARCISSGGSVVTECSETCQLASPIVTNECNKCVECKSARGAYCQIDQNEAYCVNSMFDMEMCYMRGGIIVDDCQDISETFCNFDFIATRGFCIIGATCEQCAACWANQIIGRPYNYTFPEECGARTIEVDNCLTICDTYNKGMNYTNMDPTIVDRCLAGSVSSSTSREITVVNGMTYACLKLDLSFTFFTIQGQATNDDVVQFLTQCIINGGTPITNCPNELGDTTTTINTTTLECENCHSNNLYYCETDHTCYTLRDTVNCDGNVSCCNDCPLGVSGDTFIDNCPLTETPTQILLKIKSLFIGFPASNNWYSGIPYCDFDGVDCVSSTLNLAGLPLTLTNANQAAEAGRLFMCLTRYLHNIDIAYSTISFELPTFLSPFAVYLDFSNTLITGRLPYAVYPSIALKSFNIDHTEVSGAIPFSWGNLPGIQYFSAAFTNLDSIPPISLYQLHNLKLFDVRCTGIVESTTGGFTFEKFIQNTGASVPNQVGTCPPGDTVSPRVPVYNNCQPFGNGLLDSALAQVPAGSILCASVNATQDIVIEVVVGNICPEGTNTICAIPPVTPEVPNMNDTLCTLCEDCAFGDNFFCLQSQVSSIASACIASTPTNRANCAFNAGLVLDTCTRSPTGPETVVICTICNILGNLPEIEISANVCVDIATGLVRFVDNLDTCTCVEIGLNKNSFECGTAVCSNTDDLIPDVITNLINCTECLVQTTLNGLMLCAAVNGGLQTPYYFAPTEANIAACLNVKGAPLSDCDDYGLLCIKPIDQVIDCVECTLLTAISTIGSIGFCYLPSTGTTVPVNNQVDYTQCILNGGFNYKTCNDGRQTECNINVVIPANTTGVCLEAQQALQPTFQLCYIPGTDPIFTPVNSAIACNLLSGVIITTCDIFNGVPNDICIQCLKDVAAGNDVPVCIYNNRTVPITDVFTRIECEVTKGTYLLGDCASFDTCSYLNPIIDNCLTCEVKTDGILTHPCIVSETLVGQVIPITTIVPTTSENDCDERNGIFYNNCTDIFPNCDPIPIPDVLPCLICQTAFKTFNPLGLCINDTTKAFAIIETEADILLCGDKGGIFEDTCKDKNNETCPLANIADDINSKFAIALNALPDGLQLCYYLDPLGNAAFANVTTINECIELGGSIVTDGSLLGPIFNTIPIIDCLACLNTIGKTNTNAYCGIGGSFTLLTDVFTSVDCGLAGGFVTTKCSDYQSCPYPELPLGNCTACLASTVNGLLDICVTATTTVDGIIPNYVYNAVEVGEPCNPGVRYDTCENIIGSCLPKLLLPAINCTVCQAVALANPTSIGVCVSDLGVTAPVFTRDEAQLCLAFGHAFSNQCTDTTGTLCAALPEGLTGDSILSQCVNALQTADNTEKLCYKPTTAENIFTVVLTEQQCELLGGTLLTGCTFVGGISSADCLSCTTVLPSTSVGTYCLVDGNIPTLIGPDSTVTSTLDCILKGFVVINNNCNSSPTCPYPDQTDCISCITESAINALGIVCAKTVFTEGSPIPVWEYTQSDAGFCDQGTALENCSAAIADCITSTSSLIPCAVCEALTLLHPPGPKGFCINGVAITPLNVNADIELCIGNGGRPFTECTQLDGTECDPLPLTPDNDATIRNCLAVNSTKLPGQSMCYAPSLPVAITPVITDAECKAINGTIIDDCNLFGAINMDTCAACITEKKPSTTNMYCYNDNKWTSIVAAGANECRLNGGLVIDSCDDFSTCSTPALPATLQNCLACSNHTGYFTREICFNIAVNPLSVKYDVSYSLPLLGANECLPTASATVKCSDLFPGCASTGLYSTGIDCDNALAELLKRRTAVAGSPYQICLQLAGSTFANSVSGSCSTGYGLIDTRNIFNCANNRPAVIPLCTLYGTCASDSTYLNFCVNGALSKCAKFTPTSTNNEVIQFINECRLTVPLPYFTSKRPADDNLCTNILP